MEKEREAFKKRSKVGPIGDEEATEAGGNQIVLCLLNPREVTALMSVVL